MAFLALSSGHGVIFKKGLSIPEATKLECMYITNLHIMHNNYLVQSQLSLVQNCLAKKTIRIQ